MTFTEWYEATYREKWNPDFATFDIWEWMVEYEAYCNFEEIEPVWNG